MCYMLVCIEHMSKSPTEQIPKGSQGPYQVGSSLHNRLQYHPQRCVMVASPTPESFEPVTPHNLVVHFLCPKRSTQKNELNPKMVRTIGNSRRTTNGVGVPSSPVRLKHKYQTILVRHCYFGLDSRFDISIQVG